jgi:cysteine desulfurase
MRAAEAVAAARAQVAGLIGAQPHALVFTSGATESINLALKGLAESAGDRRRHVVTCATEHPAVLDSCAWLESCGLTVTRLAVDEQGHLDEAELAEAITEETLCLSLMLANNEVGTLHPLARYASLAHAKGAFVHCDGTQAVGKVPVDVDALGVDLLSFSAHKLHGPKGIGVLYRRIKDPRVRLVAQVHGGGHERGLRSGTANVPGIVGMGAACAIAGERMQADAAHARALTDRFLAGLKGLDYQLNGDPINRLPGNLSLWFPGLSATALMEALPEIAMATGSACSTARPGASHVLMAMGLGGARTAETVRLGCGRFTTSDEIDEAVRQFRAAIAVLAGQTRETERCRI